MPLFDPQSLVSFVRAQPLRLAGLCTPLRILLCVMKDTELEKL